MSKNKQDKSNLLIIEQFPVGTPFSWICLPGDAPWYGWVVGYALNDIGEAVFRVRWMHRDEELLLHPADVQRISYDWDKP